MPLGTSAIAKGMARIGGLVERVADYVGGRFGSAPTLLSDCDILLTGALDASDVDIAILDEAGTILFVNGVWLTLSDLHTSQSRENLIGKNYFEILTLDKTIEPRVAEKTAQGIRSVLEGKAAHFEYEYPAARNDGESWYRLNVNRFRRPLPVRVVISHENITERRIAEQKLLNKQEKLRSIYHASSDGILLVNEQGIFDCNERSAKLLGAEEPADLHGKQLTEIAVPAASTIPRYFEIVRKMGEAQFEASLTRIDGSVFPAEVLLTTFLHNSELVVQVTFRDITERRIAEQRMQQLNQRLQDDLKSRTEAERRIRETTAYLDVYRKIVETHAIVAETDTAGKILNVNEAFCRISGYSKEELIGQNHRILNSGSHPKEMWQEMYRTVANGGIWHGEICNRAKDGHLYWVDTTIAPLYSDDGKLRGYFALRADITSLKTARAQAEAASRSKSEFLANMSHEIRTPMTAILGYADLLAELLTCDNCQLSPEASLAVETIKRNGEHLLSIINDILDISKIEADKLTIESMVTDVPKLINEVLATMQVKSQAKGLTLDFELETAIPQTIITDPTRLRQILVNLIGNAIKFTEHGRVLLKLACDPAQPEMLQLTVQDSGIGMDEEHLARLFQAFEQADTSMTRRFGGTGLGLRISKRLAMMLGGDITVQSRLGEGSCFTVSISTGSCSSLKIPSLKSDACSEACQDPTHLTCAANKPGITSHQAPASKRLEGKRILLVEDGPDNQRLIMHHLRKAGAEVTLACNGKLAVEALTADGTVDGPLRDVLPFDLILMDMQMPVMDGREATELLRGKGATLPILALTAHAMQADLQMCLDAGCDARITKPIDREELIEACRAHLTPSLVGITSAIGIQTNSPSNSASPA